MKNLNNLFPKLRKQIFISVCIFLLPLSIFAQYTLTSNDVTFSNGVITAYTNTTQTDIIIPDNFGGITVTGIGSNAFQNKSITNVIIPSSVTSIGSNAFNGCTGLTSITIPSNVTSIDGWAFKNCTKLASLNYNADNCTFKSSSYGG